VVAHKAVENGKCRTYRSLVSGRERMSRATRRHKVMPDDTHMDLSERAAAPEQMLALRTADGDKARNLTHPPP
jgi:hypothetical protein